MKNNLLFCRTSLLLSAIIFGGIGLAIATIVIPSVKADVFPHATPERAVPVFWVFFALHLFIAAVILIISFRVTGRSGPIITFLIIFALLALLFAFALMDAASAYTEHGSMMHTASLILFVCVGAEIIAAALLSTLAFLFARRT